MGDLHEVVFVWPDTGPQDVILTGSFDQWAASVHLTKAAGGFEGKVKVPWGTRIPYKFIVDGRWTTLQSQPQEPDNLGNLNNIYDSPLKPEETPAPEDATTGEAEDTSEKLTSTSVPPVSSTIDVAPSAMEFPDSNLEDTPVDPIILPASDAIPVTESTALPPPDIHSVVEFAAPPPTILSPAAEAETVISPESVHPKVLLESADPPIISSNEPTPLTISDNDSKSTEPTSSGKKSDAIQFPLGESPPQPSSASNNPKSSTEPPKPEKPTTPTESVDSEHKTPSFVPSSAPSSPASHLRGAFQARQRSISSKSGSVRSESGRSKRHSLFGKVKHLFHLDKDS